LRLSYIPKAFRQNPQTEDDGESKIAQHSLKNLQNVKELKDLGGIDLKISGIKLQSPTPPAEK
jgi:hypothetical protein